ncbi:hypothetical protein M0813_08312 [Anaeramoeba flamelloides]|uniref:Uncharacterized protein n=1 Tax=Anaeramoeba flamelloides TaxID=1746091 RepID=A0ABQ8X8E0_9EUKA|nr:hypothetical protein M0813_08312 [Anaeramoeba flamelloides]
MSNPRHRSLIFTSSLLNTTNGLFESHEQQKQNQNQNQNRNSNRIGNLKMKFLQQKVQKLEKENQDLRGKQYEQQKTYLDEKKAILDEKNTILEEKNTLCLLINKLNKEKQGMEEYRVYGKQISDLVNEKHRLLNLNLKLKKRCTDLRSKARKLCNQIVKQKSIIKHQQKKQEKQKKIMKKSSSMSQMRKIHKSMDSLSFVKIHPQTRTVDDNQLYSEHIIEEIQSELGSTSESLHNFEFSKINERYNLNDVDYGEDNFHCYQESQISVDQSSYNLLKRQSMKTKKQFQRILLELKNMNQILNGKNEIIKNLKATVEDCKAQEKKQTLTIDNLSSIGKENQAIINSLKIANRSLNLELEQLESKFINKIKELEKKTNNTSSLISNKMKMFPKKKKFKKLAKENELISFKIKYEQQQVSIRQKQQDYNVLQRMLNKRDLQIQNLQTQLEQKK